MQKSKRVLSLILVMMMVLSLLPATALATGGEPASEPAVNPAEVENSAGSSGASVSGEETSEPTVTGVAVTPAAATVEKGSTQSFSAEVKGENGPSQEVTWKVTGKASPDTSISSDGVLTVAADETGVALTVKAISVADPSKSGTAAVTVPYELPDSLAIDTVLGQAPVVTGFADLTGVLGIYMVQGTLAVSAGADTLTAEDIVTKDPASTAVLFDSGGGGTLDSVSLAAEGVTNVSIRVTPASGTPTGSYFLAVSRSLTEPTVTGVTVTPSSVTVEKGSTQQFTATVTGENGPSQEVTWSIDDKYGSVMFSTISGEGLLTVGATEWAAKITVKATSVADPTVSGTATVTVPYEQLSDSLMLHSILGESPKIIATVNASQYYMYIVAELDIPAGVDTITTSDIITIDPASTVGPFFLADDLTADSISLSPAGETTVVQFDVHPPSESDPFIYYMLIINRSLPEPDVSGVTVNPSAVAVERGATQSFSAVVDGTNDPSQVVTWSIDEDTDVDTFISRRGVLTVSADETAETLTVRATSAADPTQSGTAVVTVERPAGEATVTGVAVTPSQISLYKGATQSFSAAVTGEGSSTPSQRVTWSVEGAAAADTSISDTGTLTVSADETAETLTVRATSVADPHYSGTAAVTVTDAFISVTADSRAGTQVRIPADDGGASAANFSARFLELISASEASSKGKLAEYNDAVEAFKNNFYLGGAGGYESHYAVLDFELYGEDGSLYAGDISGAEVFYRCLDAYGDVLTEYTQSSTHVLNSWDAWYLEAYEYDPDSGAWIQIDVDDTRIPASELDAEDRDPNTLYMRFKPTRADSTILLVQRKIDSKPDSLPAGQYSVPVHLAHNSANGLSMANAALIQTAALDVGENGNWKIILDFKEMDSMPGARVAAVWYLESEADAQAFWFGDLDPDDEAVQARYLHDVGVLETVSDGATHIYPARVSISLDNIPEDYVWLYFYANAMGEENKRPARLKIHWGRLTDGNGNPVDIGGEIDLTPLQAALDEAKGYTDLSGYTEQSAQTLLDAIAEAEAALENASVITLFQRNSLTAALQNAIAGLEEVVEVDRSRLQAAVEAAEAAIAAGTDERLTAETEAYVNAKAVLADMIASQAEIDAAQRALKDLLNEITEKQITDGQMAAFKAALAAAEAKAGEADARDTYTPESLAALAVAIDNAQHAIYGDGFERLTEALAAKLISRLEAAIAGLVELPQVDKTALSALLAAAQAIDQSLYKDTAALDTALTAAQDILANEQTTRNEILEAEEALRAALAGLEHKAKSSLDEPGAHDVPIIVRNAYSSQLSMANDAIGHSAVVEVDAEGNATLNVEFNPMYLSSLNQWGHLERAWYFESEAERNAYDQDLNSSHLKSVTYSEWYTVDEADPGVKIPAEAGDPGAFPGKISFPLPSMEYDANGEIIVHIRVQVDAMPGSNQNARFVLDVSDYIPEPENPELDAARDLLWAELEQAIADLSGYTSDSARAYTEALNNAYAAYYGTDIEAIENAKARLESAKANLKIFNVPVKAVDWATVESGVEVIGAADIVAGVKLKAVAEGDLNGLDDSTKTQIKNLIAGTLENNETLGANAVVFTIQLLDNLGNSVQPGTPVTVRIPIPSNIDRSKLKIIAIHDSGGSNEASVISGTIVGDFYEFTIDQFSHFILAEVETGSGSDVDITGFEPIADLNGGTVSVPVYADAAAVIAALPATVTIAGTSVTIPVTGWTDTDGYNPNVAGSYTFTANLGEIPAGYRLGEGVTATVEVVVAESAPVADKTELKAAISRADEELAKSIYTDASYNALKTAAAAAKAVNENETATQQEVDDAAATLTEAINDLKKRPVAPGADTFSDEATGVKLEAEAGVLPEETTMKVIAVTTGADYEKAKLALEGIGGSFRLYDITLLGPNGSAIQPNGKVKVSIPVPEGMKEKLIAVYSINADGTKTLLESTIENGYVVFYTDHFSLYAIVEKSAAGDSGGDKPDKKAVKESGKSAVPKTGSHEPSILWRLLPLAAAAIALLMVSRRRKEGGKPA